MDEKERFFSFILKIINIINIRDLNVIYVLLAHSLFRIKINSSSWGIPSACREKNRDTEKDGDERGVRREIKKREFASRSNDESRAWLPSLPSLPVSFRPQFCNLSLTLYFFFPFFFIQYDFSNPLRFFLLIWFDFIFLVDFRRKVNGLSLLFYTTPLLWSVPSLNVFIDWINTFFSLYFLLLYLVFALAI